MQRSLFINDGLANTFFNNEYISRTIDNKIEEFLSWNNGVRYHRTHFINHRGRSYISSIYRCLFHSINLETDIFDEISEPVDNFASQYLGQ